MFYESKTQLIQFTDQQRGAKVGIELSINNNIKSPQTQVSEHVRKKLWNLLTQLIKFTVQPK